MSTHMFLWRKRGFSLKSPQRGDSNEYPQHMFLWRKRGYSLKSPQRGDSNEYPQRMFLWRTEENYPSIIIQYPPYVFFWVMPFKCLDPINDFESIGKYNIIEDMI